MADRIRSIGIIIAIIAGITLPTLAIAWAGGGRLAKAEVRIDNNEGDIKDNSVSDRTRDVESRLRLKEHEKEDADAKIAVQDDIEELRVEQTQALIRDHRNEAAYQKILIHMEIQTTGIKEVKRTVDDNSTRLQEQQLILTQTQERVDNLMKDD